MQIRGFRFLLSLLLVSGTSFIMQGQSREAVTGYLFFHATGYFEQGKYDSAIVYYTRFLQGASSVLNDIQLQGNTKVERSERERVDLAYLRLASSYSATSRYDSTLQILYRGLNEPVMAAVRTTSREAQYYQQIGSCLLMKRAYPQALEWYRRCLTITGGKGILAIDAWQNIGNIFYFEADYENAIMNYQEAWIKNLSLKRRIPVRLYQTLASLGAAYVENNEPSKGVSCLLNAGKLIASDNPSDSVTLAGVMLNLGSAYFKLNKPSLALVSYFRGLHFLNDSIHVRRNERLVGYRGIAACYSSIGCSDSAVYYLEKTIAGISGEDDQGRNETASVYCMIGDLFREQGAYDQASSNYRSALKLLIPDFRPDGSSIPEALDISVDPVELFRVFIKNGEILLLDGTRNGYDQGSLKQAFNIFCQAIDLGGKIQQNLGQEGSRINFNDAAKSVFAGAVEAAYRLWRTGLNEYKDTLFQIAESCRSKILTSLVNERNVIKSNDAEDTLVQRRKFLHHEIGSISRRRLTQRPGEVNYPEISYWEELGKIIELKLESERLDKSCEEMIPGFTAQKFARHKITSAEIREKLNRDEALLDYFSADSSIYLFLFTHDSCHIQLISRDEGLHDQLLNFQKSIKCADFQKFQNQGHHLYKRLIEPVARYLKGKQYLIIIPDEELFSLPFEALVTKYSEPTNKSRYRNFQYLVQDFAISYHFSLAAFLDSKKREMVTSGSFLGFAPVFDHKQSLQVPYDPLTSSFSEISTIGSMFRDKFHNARIMTNSSAAKAHFLALSGSYTHLHIATHSVIDETHQDLTGLAFAPEISDGLPGIGNSVLWRDEIENIDLNADLLVLSACATGKGRLTKTEGMLALPRSFYLAGASNILYTLWNIPDLQTRDFMIDFYRGFLHGQSYSSSLRDAKLKMIARAETSMPYLWAGFVLLGK